MDARPPHKVRLKDAFAGVPAGAELLISSPPEIEHFLRTHVPLGVTMPVQQLRRKLADLHGADATCPVSTSLFLRTISEVAWEQLQAGASTHDVAPFWRVVDPASPLARKLSCGPEWIRQRLAAERSGDQP